MSSMEKVAEIDDGLEALSSHCRYMYVEFLCLVVFVLYSSSYTS